MLPNFRTASGLAPVTAGSINRLDSWFNALAGNDDGLQNQAWSRFPMAIWEDEEQYHVEAELPGVAENDVDVTVHNDTLTIRGERKSEQGRQYSYNGRWFGRFERVVTLPEMVHADQAQARFTDGILRIDLPKRPEAKPKRISVTTS